MGRPFALTVAATLSAAWGASTAWGATLDDVLARMDSAAKSFRSYSATAKVVDYTKVFDDSSESTAAIRLRKTPHGVQAIVELSSGPDRHTWCFNGSQAQHYLPNARMVLEYRQLAAAAERFLTLGFSSTRAELNRDFAITLGGVESIGSDRASRIVLRPTSKDAAQIARTTELWIPDGKGIAMQQKLTAPNGDYHLVTFTSVQANPALPDSAFQLSVPPGTTRQRVN